MSIAHKCDLCDVPFERAKGDVSISEIYVMRADGSDNSWEGFDFCPKCSKKILAVIGPAMRGLKRARAK